MTKWVTDKQGQPLPRMSFLGAVVDDDVVGHVTLRLQAIVCPATAWSKGEETPVLGVHGEPLNETFVQTYGVDKHFRRCGIGTALQRAALALTSDLGCYQMRSWSSADRTANYALKVKLGFAIHPAVQELPDGRRISGVYFVKTVG